jgi:hypothetical protein
MKLKIFYTLVTISILWIIGINGYVFIDWIRNSDLTYMQLFLKWWKFLVPTYIVGGILSWVSKLFTN